MEQQAIILFSKAPELERVVQKLLCELSIKVDIAHSGTAVANCFKANDARILLICFDSLVQGMDAYAELFNENSALGHKSHRAIAICRQSEAASAVAYCLEQTMDDYYIVDSAVDPDRLQLIIGKSVNELKMEGDYFNCTSYLSVLKEQSKILDNYVHDGFNECQSIIDFSNTSYSKLIQVFDRNLAGVISDISQDDAIQHLHGLTELSQRLATLRLDFLAKPAEILHTDLNKYHSSWADEKFKHYSRLSRKVHVPPSIAKSLTTGKVLIVDDDELYRDILVAMLEAEGYIVLTAESGEQALETLRHAMPDVIILDIDMPVMNGIQLLKLIRAEERWDEVPILMLTGMVDDETLQDSIKAGANGFFSKPGSEQDGFETVDFLFRDKGVLKARHRQTRVNMLLTQLQQQAIKPLVIDDDIFMQEIIGSLLDGLGIQQWSAVAGAIEALKISEQFNVLILDLNMPGMDGIELLRHLAEAKYRGSIIIISGYGSRLLRSVENLGNAHKLNLIGSLGKPITPLKLAEMLNKVSLDQVVDKHLAAEAWVPSRAEMESAIDADEFIFHYQPKIEMKTKTVVGVEALARW